MIIFKNNLLNGITNKVITPSMLLEDNEGCIFIIKNQHTSSRTKHIDIRAHLIREHYSNKIFDVIKVDTTEQDGDPLTKNLREEDYNKHPINSEMGHHLFTKTGMI